MSGFNQDIIEEHMGVKYSTELTVVKQANGEYKATQRVTQKTTEDLKEWNEVSVDFEAKSRKVNQAVAEVSVLATLYLESINYDLFAVDNELAEGEYLQ